jgi:hypothetical protein
MRSSGDQKQTGAIVPAAHAGKSVCLTGLPRIAALLHVLRAERGPSPVLALAIVEVYSLQMPSLTNNSCAQGIQAPDDRFYGFYMLVVRTAL